METARGFSSRQTGNAVLNFFERVLGSRHSLIFFAARMAPSNNFTDA